MAKYRKKPVTIEAIQYTGRNYDELKRFCGGVEIIYDLLNKCIYIPTLEGDMKASERDFIIKGVNGEYYPCKPDIFEKTYESVSD